MKAPALNKLRISLDISGIEGRNGTHITPWNSKRSNIQKLSSPNPCSYSVTNNVLRYKYQEYDKYQTVRLTEDIGTVFKG